MTKVICSKKDNCSLAYNCWGAEPHEPREDEPCSYYNPVESEAINITHRGIYKMSVTERDESARIPFLKLTVSNAPVSEKFEKHLKNIHEKLLKVIKDEIILEEEGYFGAIHFEIEGSVWARCKDDA